MQPLSTVLDALQAHGELVVVYFNFVRSSKLESIYGREKLEAVLDTVASAVRECLDARSWAATITPHDDNFVVFLVPSVDVADRARDIEERVIARIDAVHGEEISALCEIVSGRSDIRKDPRIRFERLVYRGIREAAGAARSVEQRERLRRIAELKTSIRERAIYVDYHPIVVATSGDVFGYEALARGLRRGLRRPDVMFEIAAEANLIWELSRLCRATALEGMSRLGPGELLFLNVDPHDFADPDFDLSGDPRRLVIEITERIAIKDYPRVRERLGAFRARGVRIAVDDAGSGYAGLGTIANLEPNFIKLDMSLIAGIDASATKRHLVETMVRFANEQDAMVIAEGVERAEEFAVVQRLGVHLVQGFFVDQAPERRAVPAISRSTSANDRLAAPNP